jgi:hypothetical protein
MGTIDRDGCCGKVVNVMIILELSFALMVAFALSAIFAIVTRGSYRGIDLFLYFLIIFLSTWAFGIWIEPFGPTMWGVPWLMYIFVGFIFSLLVSLSYSRKRVMSRRETLELLDRIEERKKIEQVTSISLNLFFWMLVFILTAAIIIRYVTRL